MASFWVRLANHERDDRAKSCADRLSRNPQRGSNRLLARRGVAINKLASRATASLRR